MGVYRPRGSSIYCYDFEFRGQRYRASTGQRDKGDAERVEWRLKERLAQEAQGIAPVDRDETPASPLIQDWANIYLAHKMSDNTDERKRKRPDLIERTLRIFLRFAGSCPSNPRWHPKPGEDAPFKNLTLADFVEQPALVQEFVDWMGRRRRILPTRRIDPKDAPPRYGALISASQKRSLLAVAGGLYKVALLPKYRALTGVTTNPFEHIPRGRFKRRKLRLSLEQLRAWFKEAAPHVKIALAIGALAPALRKDNILALEWDAHLDRGWTTITVSEHKTDEFSEPIVAPVTPQLREILNIAWHHRRSTETVPPRAYVVHYRGERVKDVKKALASAARRAGVPYGLQTGSTFHTLRHYASTLLARKKVSVQERMAASGHIDVKTEQIYTHMAGADAVDALAILSEQTPLSDLISTNPKGHKHSWGTTGETTGTQTPRKPKISRKLGVVVDMASARKTG